MHQHDHGTRRPRFEIINLPRWDVRQQSSRCQVDLAELTMADVVRNGLLADITKEHSNVRYAPTADITSQFGNSALKDKSAVIQCCRRFLPTVVEMAYLRESYSYKIPQAETSGVAARRSRGVRAAI